MEQLSDIKDIINGFAQTWEGRVYGLEEALEELEAVAESSGVESEALSQLQHRLHQKKAVAQEAKDRLTNAWELLECGE